MGKAVYVLNEMPESCLKCYFSEDFDDEEQMESKVVCTLPMMDGRDLSKFASERPSWCPLKEAPQRHDGSHLTREEFKNMPSDDMTLKFGADMMDIGWNSCLDMILEM